MTGKVLVRFFASARLAAGVEHVSLDCPAEGLSEGDFRALIVRDFPGLAPVQSSLRLARNFQYMVGQERILPDDEVALIPPVSGG